MDNILVNVINIKRYDGDVVIFSATEEIHIKHLENELALLFKHGIRIRLKKLQHRVEFLVIFIQKEGTHTDERKVKAICDAHSPSNRKSKGLSLE